MKRWTKQEIGKIIELRKCNRNFQYIANYFCVTPNAIRKALQRHNLNYNKKPRKTDIQYFVFETKTKSILEIAKENQQRMKQNLPLLKVL